MPYWQEAHALTSQANLKKPYKTMIMHLKQIHKNQDLGRHIDKLEDLVHQETLHQNNLKKIQ